MSNAVDFRRRSAAGFSLLELVLAIVTLGVLAVLLVSGISGIRARAAAVKCLANLREIHRGIIAYANDQRGAFPYAYSYGSPMPGEPIVGAFKRYENWSGQLVLNNYVGSWEVFKCPSAPLNWSDDPSKYYHYARDGAFVHYAYNGYLARPEGAENAFPRGCFFGYLANVHNPSKVLLLYDGAFRTNGEATSGFYLFYDRDVAHFRHQDWINVIYVDGHVESHRKTDFPNTPDDPIGKYHIRKDLN